MTPPLAVLPFIRSLPMLLPALLLQIATAAPTPAPGRTPDDRRTTRVGAPVPRPTRVTRAPTIDGRDTDEVWQGVPVISEFRQFEPAEDGEPSLRTEARIAYDAHNVYVVVRSFDAKPDSILSVLQRRDAMLMSDDMIIGIDSYNDKRTGYMFRLTAAGAMADGYVFNDGDEDWGWNAVWEGAAHVDSIGWVAEYRIPLSQLRYVPRGDNTFGLLIIRRTARNGERVSWPLMRRSKTGNVSQWGDVAGFEALSAPRRVEVMPYAVGRYGYKPLGDGTPRNTAQTQFGADLKLGLTSNVTLDGAINPDFGQVEADPGVLNLSAFEQFFAERRPFFLEGSGIFRYDIDCDDGECTGLFYSRRIGRTPQLRGRYGDEASPLQSTITGAAKITGRLRNGLSIGFLDAVTDRVQGTQARTIEPLTNYGVMRLQQDLRGGNSGVGVMLTNTTRQLDEFSRDFLRGDAWTGGLDARHRFHQNQYQVSMQLAGSRVSGTAEAIARTQRSNVHLYQRDDASHLSFDSTRTMLTGSMTQLSLNKQGGGITRFSVNAWYLTPGFEINDVGFRTRSDETGGSAWFALRPTKPFSIFRRGQLNFNAWGVQNTGGMNIGNGGNVNANGQFVNFWNGYMGVGVNNLITSYDDRNARGGPAVYSPRRMQTWAGIDGDGRKAIAPSVNFNGGRRFDGLGSSWNVSAGARVRIGGRLNGSINAGYGRNIDDQQWVDNLVDNGVTSYTFARLYQSTSSVTMRVNYTLTPTLSVESYLQPFVSIGEYTNWRALADGRSTDVNARFRPYTTRGTADGFRFGQLRTNNVVRWEYRPGSVLFFVFTQGRDAFTGRPDDFGEAPAWNDLFDRRPQNVFLIKSSYWFGR
ncbi:MAG: carbohydrate binding family 9 domain-containing protein [Gemmatimonadaceae bacterium]|nr:carbohydrate binding family 9 domain-containing protein [Gemmatimonadaceae bacterium]